MARISQDELERLKASISLTRLVEARGITLGPHGASGDLVGLCPLHEEDTPSMVVTPAKNLWHCFGCDAGGDAIEWVRRSQGVSFRHAVELLRAEDPGPATAAGSYAKVSTVRKLPPPIARNADDHQVLSQAMDFYHQAFLTSREAASYLEGRGLGPAEDLAGHFRIGFGNRTLGYRLPMKNRQAGAEIRGRLERLGILKPSGHELFSGCITFPVLDSEGRVATVYGRKVARVLPTGASPHLYLPGPHRGVWNEPGLRGTEDVILCEAIIDALTFWAAGYRNVTASFGVHGFTEDHLAAFRRHGVRRVLIAYDRDDAGDGAALTLAEKLAVAGFDCYRVLFARGMDANDHVRKAHSPATSLGALLRAAAWLGQGKPPSQAAVAVAPRLGSGQAAKEEAMAPPPGIAEPSPAPAAALPTPTTSPPTPAAPATPPEPGPALRSLPLAAPPASLPLPKPPAASPVPTTDAAASSLTAEIEDGLVKIPIGDRLYRVIGLAQNQELGQLRINLMVRRGEVFYVDTLDLYAARFRALYVKHASEEIDVAEDVLKVDLGRVLGKLEEIQEEARRKAKAPKEPAVVLTEERRRAAMGLLKNPRLMERILEAFATCGVVGEDVNKITAYVAAVSRKNEEPLAILIQSSSSAGKSHVVQKALAFVPEEDRIVLSAMTGQALFYMQDLDLRHKVLSIAEQEGASRASYSLKLLLSEGQLTIASTGKDPVTGELRTKHYKVQGPVVLFLTTTAIEIDEELLNRCIVLTVDEGREQTRAIHQAQRHRTTLEGWRGARDRAQLVELHQDAQRLLSPIKVINPYGNELTFLDTKTRTRRDHVKYLGLIEAITLLHQHQRLVKMDVGEDGKEVPYIETTREDILWANRLANVVLGRTLAELPGQTEGVLFSIHEMVTRCCREKQVRPQDYRFTRREVIDASGLSLGQVRVHLERLIELEYVLVHRGGRGQSFEYELLYRGEGRDGRRFVLGLLDLDALPAATATTTKANLAEFSGGVAEQNGGVVGSWRPHGGPMVGGWRTPLGALEATSDKAFVGSALDLVENAHGGVATESTSYTQMHRGTATAPPAPPGGNGAPPAR